MTMSPETDVAWLWKAVATVLALFAAVFGGLLKHAHDRIDDITKQVSAGDTAAGQEARDGDDKLWVELRRLSEVLQRHQDDVHRTLREMTGQLNALPTRKELVEMLRRRAGDD